MNVALRQFDAAMPAAERASRRTARIKLFHDFAAAEPAWRALERNNALATPYQSYDFLALWQHHVGAAAGVRPLLVAGYDAAGAPLFLMPFGVRRCGGLRAVEFLGGTHANFNMALWRRDAAASAGEGDIRAALAALKGHADAVLLRNQPLTWQGSANPFAYLPHQASPNMGHSGALAADFEALLRARTNAQTRKKFRKKAQALAGFGTVQFERARSGEDARRVLDAFFKQKNARMRALGIRDVFAMPSVRRFIEAGATTPSASGYGVDAVPVIEIYTLSVNDIVIATMGGIVGGGRFCAMFNSITPDRFHAESPGEQLILNLARHCCERGLHTFDLGVGEARYKNMLCGDAEPLFDCFIALTPAGRLLTAAARAGASFKRAIKRNGALWSLVQSGRRLRARYLPG
jgi:CelD/BcsL family acetyltransferase involved in cellulose biosynthesis